MSNQKQVNEGGNATLSVKVSKETYDLLKMFIHAFIESAKHSGPVSNEMRMLLDKLRLEEGWHKHFNFADVNAQKEVAQVVLILQQPGRKGFGMTMIDRPFMGDARQTYCVDDILERIAEVSMKGLYKELRQVGVAYKTESLRETLTMMCDAQLIDHLNQMDADELPQVGNFHDFGRAIEYGKKYKRKPHRTPDGVANSQQSIRFDEDDATTTDTPDLRPYGEQADKYLADLEERAKEEELGFRPFDQEA